MKVKCIDCETPIMLATSNDNDGRCFPCLRIHRNPFRDEKQTFGATIHYLDASAMIPYFIDEEHSSLIREYIARAMFCNLAFRTTSLCFGETLGAIKARNVRGSIDFEKYSAISKEVMNKSRSWFDVQEPFFYVDPTYQNRVLAGMAKHKLDVSDIFQLVTVKWMSEEFMKGFKDGVRVVLITGDARLASAARAENIRTWHFTTEPSGPPLLLS